MKQIKKPLLILVLFIGFLCVSDTVSADSYLDTIAISSTGTISLSPLPNSTTTFVWLELNCGSVVSPRVPCTGVYEPIFTKIPRMTQVLSYDLKSSIAGDTLHAINPTLYPYGQYMIRVSHGEDPTNSSVSWVASSSVYFTYTAGNNFNFDYIDIEPYTHIITSDPNDEEIITATSSSLILGYTGYLNESDFGEDNKLIFTVTPFYQDNSWTGGTVMDAFDSVGNTFQYIQELNDFGDFVYSTTTATSTFKEGMYTMTYQFTKGKWCAFGYCLGTDVFKRETRTFTMGTTTGGDLMKLETIRIAGILNGSATSTASAFKECGITNFDFFACFSDLIVFAFIPTDDAISYNVDIIKNSVLIKWPVGYVTDFVTILATTSTTTLKVLDFTLPVGIAGAGSHFEFDLSHKLDFILNATSSSFNNSSASSTRTFYEITNDYWVIICYLLAFLYIINRILGSGLIGRSQFIKKEEIKK